MRPQYLKIEGLQSFKESQYIDFEKLGQNGLFGIFGSTGSGKSTILDAITLALYGNVLRASRGTYGIINTYSKFASVSFAFNVKNGNKRIYYKVERLYKRKKGDDKASELKLARLSKIIHDSETVIADKDREVTQKVIEILGLNLNDFTRAVVLPQNKFQDFLMLSKAEKRDMIERLFCLEEYGRSLSGKVNVALQSVNNNILTEEGGITALGDISEKKVKEYKEQVHMLEKEKEHLSRKLKDMEKEYRTAEENRSMTIEYEYIQKQLTKHLKNNEEYEKKKQILDNAKRANSLSEYIQSFKDISNELSQTEKEYEELQNEVADLTVKYNALTERNAKFCNKYEKETSNIIEQKSKYESLLETEEIINTNILKKQELEKDLDKIKEQHEKNIRDIENVKRAYDSNNTKLKEVNDTLKAIFIEPEYRRDIYKLNSITEKIEEEVIKIDHLDRTLKAYEKELNKLNCIYQDIDKNLDMNNSELTKNKNKHCHLEKNMPLSKEDILQKEKEAYKISRSAEKLKEIRNKISDVREYMEDIHKHINNAQKEKEMHKKLFLKIEKNYNLIKDQKERQIISNLVQNLKEGEECPVCGSKNHPSPVKINKLEHFKNNIEIEKMQEEKERISKLLSEDERNELLYIEKMKDLDEKLIELKNDEQNILKQLNTNNIFNINTEKSISDTIEDIEYEIIEDKNKFQDWETNKNQTKIAIENIKDCINDILKEQQVIATKIQNTENNIKEKKEERETIANLLLHKKEISKEICYKFSIGNVKKEINDLEKREENINILEKQKKEIELTINDLENSLRELENEKANTAQELTAVNLNIKNIENNINNEKDKIKNVFGKGNINIKGQLDFLNIKSNNLKNDKQDLEERYKACQVHLETQNRQFEALQRQLNIYTSSKKKAESELFRKIKDNNFKSIEDCINALTSEDKMNKLNEYIDSYEKELNHLQTQQTILNEKLKGNSITSEQWEEIKQSYENYSEENEEIIYKYSKIKSEYDSLMVNYDKYKKISKRLKELKEKKDKIIIIHRLLKGNSFVEYVAEERLRYVTARASELLGELTKYRYNLELDANNDYVARDNLNGGICRLVTTLSGGEIFLTSLSLALALSEQIQLKGQSPLEFFFLDEGFGTLDASLIDIVMDSLIRLISNDRIIGLISHVPELKERVSTKLLITPPDGYGSGTKVEIST